MRLGQLARKLSLRPSQLVDFLASHQIPSEEGSNTRLEDNHVELIVQHFAPESLAEILKTSAVEVMPVIETPVTLMEQVTEVVEEQPEPETITETTESSTDEPEVIRVQKIELAGLKVLGKIELPEPKKKETPSEGGEDESDKPRKKERVTRNSGRQKNTQRDREQRKWRNPIELQRQHEQRELEEKRQAELERDKEKRRQHYHQKVKQASQQPKRVKPVKAVEPKKPVDTRPVPKSWIGKFLRWWTT